MMEELPKAGTDVWPLSPRGQLLVIPQEATLTSDPVIFFSLLCPTPIFRGTHPIN